MLMAVVVRYFGGTRLGAGGLVRAYSASVQQAVEQLSLIDNIPLTQIKLLCSYPCEATVRHLLNECEGEILSSHYGEQVELQLEIPLVAKQSFLEKLNNQENGQFQQLK